MSELGYSPVNLLFDDEGRKKLYKGIKTLAKAVKSTLGPHGQTVLIESPQHTHGITVTKDGVTVARSISLLDPTEHLAVRIMKEAASRTATQAGDGTTTAIVLTEALINAGAELITPTTNKTKVLRDLVTYTNKIIDEDLKRMSRKVSASRLKDIATISANNDSNIGKIISDIYKKVGENGIVTVARSESNETYFETTHGLKIDRGYESPLFINDQKKDECIMEDVRILVSDAPIENLLNIENVLKPVIQEGLKLLIIAPTSANVVSTLAANVMKNSLKLCTIGPPSFGYKQHELMQDIAVSVGATYFSEKTGDDLSLMTLKDLGHAAKVIVGRDSTVIIKNEDETGELVNERVKQLKQSVQNAKQKADKDFILSRIASLTGGVGVISVGGNTDLEQKELYDRVDDAVCAVRSALEEGIVAGGGVALYKIATYIEDDNYQVAGKMLARALRAPLEQIYTNAGIDISEDQKTKLMYDKGNEGLNIKSGEWGDMFKMGVIDPFKVTRSALQNAVSVAVTLLSTNAIITMARTYEDK
tara:strand:- start:86 stop:1687 length:1602 start_codon:yes stop_codon:yes gene_type:complete